MDAISKLLQPLLHGITIPIPPWVRVLLACLGSAVIVSADHYGKLSHEQAAAAFLGLGAFLHVNMPSTQEPNP